MEGALGPLAGGSTVSAMTAKLRLVEIKVVDGSDLPYRVIKKRTGVTLGSFDSQVKVTIFLEQLSLDSLAAKPTRRRVR